MKWFYQRLEAGAQLTCSEETYVEILWIKRQLPLRIYLKRKAKEFFRSNCEIFHVCHWLYSWERLTVSYSPFCLSSNSDQHCEIWKLNSIELSSSTFNLQQCIYPPVLEIPLIFVYLCSAGNLHSIWTDACCGSVMLRSVMSNADRISRSIRYQLGVALASIVCIIGIFFKQ